MEDLQSLERIWLLPFWRLAVDLGLVVLIWMIQIVVYPSFLFSDRKDLVHWHGIYTGRISLIVLPLMLAQAAVVGIQLSSGFRWDHVLSAMLVIGCWVSTFTLSVPLHQRISEGEMAPEVLSALVRTNWPRTAGWTLCFLMSVLGLLHP